MAVIDKNITILGASTVVDTITITPRPDGGSFVTVSGHTSNNLGARVELSQYNITLNLGQFAPVDQMIAAALIQLRIANGLES